MKQECLHIDVLLILVFYFHFIFFSKVRDIGQNVPEKRQNLTASGTYRDVFFLCQT